MDDGKGRGMGGGWWWGMEGRRRTGPFAVVPSLDLIARVGAESSLPFPSRPHLKARFLLDKEAQSRERMHATVKNAG